MRQTKPRVLILIGAMWPGNDSSGPNRSVQGLCEALGDDFEFRIFARANSPAAPRVPVADQWVDRGFARIRYLDVGPLGARKLVASVKHAAPQVLLMNSVWDREFTLPVLAARRTGFLPKTSALLSTRGEFSSEALALKPMRKRVMRRLLLASGALDNVTLHATSRAERDDVARAFPQSRIFVAPNVRPLPPLLPHRSPKDGLLRAAFLGRISRVKGLDLALEALTRCREPVHFQICGPLEDTIYHDECVAIAAQLPSHVSVTWEGAVSADQVPRILARTDLLVLPSHSENFGHAIFEALAAGVPVLVGPKTPWQNLEEHDAGAVVPSRDPALWATKLDWFAAQAAERRAAWATGARAVAADSVSHNAAVGTWLAALTRLSEAGAPV